MLNILSVGAGGFLGATLRYLIGLIPLHENYVFPIKTFLINIVGCIAIASIVVATTSNIKINPQWILFLKVGLCGGFTTFSTFALETVDLIKANHIGIALLYAILSTLIGVIAILLIEYTSIK